MPLVTNTTITFWCAPGNGAKVHEQCGGTWRQEAGKTGPCRCSCHRHYTADEAIELMDQTPFCPRCRSTWESHDFDHEQAVRCPR